MSRIISYILTSILVLSVFLTYLGYRSYNDSNVTQSEYYSILSIAESCKNLCIFAKLNLSINITSQCLSDPDKITGKYWTYPNWACDTVNNPKTQDDELDINKCKEYLYGHVKNLIEVDNNCNVVNIIYNGKNIYYNLSNQNV